MPDNVKYDSEQIRQQFDALAEIAASDVLRGILANIADAPPEDRLSVAEQTASVEALQAAGVAIPDGLRISARYFENPSALLRGDVLMNPQPGFGVLSGGGTTCVSVGEIICVSYGWEALQ